MKILWHKRAADALHQVEEYVLCAFGEKVRYEFMNEIENAVLALADKPTIGRIDPLFAHRKQEYRSIIVRKLNKIVYYIKDDTIHIAAFWDTRREPKKQAQQTK
ncbi:MAG: type II toxin-antitoxin system RelE/ParE family toxin [Salinivirgaceae bacterium]|nr:type II toxin-antitoxin system RelE/ParE family toxin [Salinivirgaceae bacterium]